MIGSDIADEYIFPCKTIDNGSFRKIYFKSKTVLFVRSAGRPGNSEMSLTLGEKLRQAREERGYTLGEVAEQTRISSLYLESIENDDYKILPGGIFNKGFVKSFAKFVGVNEQEALSDYTRMIAQSETESDELKVYRPEVLTDDRAGASMAPTIIIAVIILAAMTAGILFLLNYLRQPADTTTVNTEAANRPAANDANTAESPVITTAPVPDMSSLKVEFKAVSEPVSLTATSDGKVSTNIVTAGSTATFEPKESLKLSYSRSLANVVELTLNGKNISLPAQPLQPRRNTIEFEINKDNLAQIWESAAISTDVPAAAPTENTNVSPNVSTPAPGRPASTPAPRPSPTTAANRATPAPTPAERSRRTPAPTPRTTVVVPSATRSPQ
jgi:cytoskeleton protein RodZ